MLGLVWPRGLRRGVVAFGAMSVRAEGGGRSDPGPDPAALTAVALACRDSERLRFTYTAADSRHSERHVEPHRLVALGRRWYLVAFDLTRHDWRSFRIDRLTGPTGDGSRFRPRELPTADAAEFVRAGVDRVARPYRVEVLVEAPADTVRERIGRWASVQAVDAGRCQVSMTTDSLDWPTMALGSLEAEFRVLEPPELIAQIRAWGERFGRAQAGPVDYPEVAS